MNTFSINKILMRFFLGGALSVALNSAFALEVSQTPLTAGTSGGTPNIMLMIDNSNSMTEVVAGTTSTRMTITKTAAKTLITDLANDTSKTVRLGLTTFDNGGDKGGKLLYPITALTSSNKDTFITTIDNIAIDDSTPTAETLADIGRYFCTIDKSLNGNGSSSNASGITLTLYPSGTKTTATVDQIFGNYNSSNGTYNNGNSTYPNRIDGLTNASSNSSALSTAPIIKACQKSAVILMTDGLPNKDREISSHLTNYSGECGTSTTSCDATATSEADSANDFCSGGLGCSATMTSATKASKPSDCIVSSGTSNTANYRNCKNGVKDGRVYVRVGSDYLDDVAQALFEMDLRPDFSIKFKNNIQTFAIGIADSTLNNDDSVLRDAAKKGGGFFRFADNLTTLSKDLKDMVTAIQNNVGSFSAIVANATQLATGVGIYQAKYDTTNWTGDLLAWELKNATDDTAGDIVKINWNAGNKIPGVINGATGSNTASYLTRNIFTHKADATGSNPKAISFANRSNTSSENICGDLTPAQRTALGITSCVATDKGVQTLDWVRGNTAFEQASNSNRYMTDPRKTNGNAKLFRNRVRFYTTDVSAAESDDGKEHIQGELRQDPWLLGDIVNSDAAYVAQENYGYSSLTEGTDYSAFVKSKSYWRKMIYIGANDGMLHGFDATIDIDGTYADEGKEILAYIPNAVYKNLPDLAKPDYTHEYFVDGSPKVRDAYLGNTKKWRSVLVGTTGAGGKAIFALDVTDVSNNTPSTDLGKTKTTAFSASDVLWEISDLTPPSNNNANKIAGNMTTGSDFVNNIGYTLPQASIGRMNDGSWVAIVANGYDSTNKRAVLYIINISDGTILAAFDTKQGNATNQNGLSTPFAADVDGNGTIDAIYAGDLLGNMWKIDVSSSNKNNWKFAYGSNTTPAPLFIATCNKGTTDCNNTKQPITAKPQVGKANSTGQTSGVMVYFGTGQYFDKTTDNNSTTAQTQSLYGVWDNCTLESEKKSGTTYPACTSIAKTSLQEQTIKEEIAASGGLTRVTSDNSFAYTGTGAKQGWYMDLKVGTANNQGEKIVYDMILRGNRIIFTTLIPILKDANPDDCESSSSAGWLMELEAITGKRPSEAVLSINSDAVIDANDLVTSSSEGSKVAPSGIQTKHGSSKTPAIMTTPDGSKEMKFTGSSSGATPSKIVESPASSNDEEAVRQSWRQL